MARMIHICGPTDCPNDETFEHDNYFGCIPKDFVPRTGRSKTKTVKQSKVDGLWKWNGGCDASGNGGPDNGSLPSCLLR